MTEEEWLNARDAASRLGVKVETLYAYVSRGILTAKREPGRRASQFAAVEIETLSKRSQGGGIAQDTNPVLHTRLTTIRGGRLYFRGRDAADLARTCGFERIAEWLWSGQSAALDSIAAPIWEADANALETCIGVQERLPEETPTPDRIRVIVATLGPLDPFRYDLGETAVQAAGRNILTTVIAALPQRSNPVEPVTLASGDTLSLATRLWSRLSEAPPDKGLVESLNAALGLLTDHELATSTFAARVAASARADPYSTVIAGLGAVAGSLHGGVGPRAVELLRRMARPAEVVPVIAEHLKHDARLPGFGHPLYPEGDPRARLVLEMLGKATLNRAQTTRLDTINRVLDVASARKMRPNIDFALASLCYVGKMPPSASEAIFAIARTAGWLAHALEEYREPPLRFRVRAEYVGADDFGPSE